MAAAEDVTATNCYYESSNASNNFIREFVDLDEFFTATTAVTQDVKMRSCEENDQSPLLNTNIDITGTFDSDGTEENYPSCLHDSRELDNEIQIQEVPQMPGADALEANEGDGQMDDGNANGVAHGASGRDKSRPSAGTDPARDNKYWDRRVKNNIAAKRSRDAKRLKEISVVGRWKFLENENERLKKQIADMKKRTNELEKKLDLTEKHTAH